MRAGGPDSGPAAAGAPAVAGKEVVEVIPYEDCTLGLPHVLIYRQKGSIERDGAIFHDNLEPTRLGQATSSLP